MENSDSDAAHVGASSVGVCTDTYTIVQGPEMLCSLLCKKLPGTMANISHQNEYKPELFDQSERKYVDLNLAKL